MSDHRWDRVQLRKVLLDPQGDTQRKELARRLLEALDTIDSQRAEMTKLYDAANEYLGNAGKGAPRGIRADLWDRLAEVVTEHETWQALNGGNESGEGSQQ